MAELYVTDEMGRNVYDAHSMRMPSGSKVRAVRYGFDTEGYKVGFVARDCLDVFGYKDKESNKAIYKYVSPENIINEDIATNAYIRVDEQHVEPVKLINLTGFFELALKSNAPDAITIRQWGYSEVLPTHEEVGISDRVSQPTNGIFSKRVVERVH